MWKLTHWFPARQHRKVHVTGISHVVKTRSDMDVFNSQSIRGTTNIGTHAENIWLIQSFKNKDGTVSTVLDVQKCRFGQQHRGGRWVNGDKFGG